MKKMNYSLSKKAALGITCILLPILITFILGYHRNKEHLEKYILHNLITAIAEANEEHVYQFLEMVKQRAQDFTSDGFIQAQLLKDSRGGKGVANSLGKHLVRNKLPLDKTIKTIYVLSRAGRVIASTDADEIGRDFSREEFYEKGKAGATVLESTITHEGLPELTISSPVFYKNTGKCIGVVVNCIQISELNRILSGEYTRDLGAPSWDKGKWKTMDVYLVNRHKQMITNPKFEKTATLKQEVNTLPVEACLTRGKETSGFYKNYKGIEVLGATMYFPQLKWALLVEIEKGEVLASGKEFLVNALTTAAVVFVTIILLFFVFLRKVVAPIRALSNAVKDISKGNFDVAVPVQSHDEIGALCKSFQDMAVQIAARTAALTESKTRLSEAQRIARMGSWEWNVVTNELYWSDEIYRIFGVDPREFDVSYEAFLQRVHPDDREFVRKSVDNALYRRQPYDIEHRILLKDATVRTVNERGEVVYGGAGQAVRMVGTVQDITERKRMEEQLQKLSCAIEQSPNIVIITDKDGNIQYVNPKFLQLTGYTLDEVMGKNPRILKSDKTPPDEFKRLWETITSGREWRGEFINKKKNGELYWEVAHISPVKNPEGVITHFLGVAEDITRIKREEEEKEKLREQLYHAQRMESVGRLAGGIAHDFNNILTAILGYGNLVQMELKEGDVIHTYVQRILMSSERAVALIKGLLAFSRKQANNPKPVSLNEVVKHVECLLLRLIGEDIRLKTVLAPDECKIMGDVGQIEQILMNLATNARDAMPDGGYLQIKTDVVELDNGFIEAHGYGKVGMYARLSFSDTGMGMDEKIREKVFEPFFTTKGVGKGTGLGLAMVYGIVKQHDGYVNVYSEPGKGTTFKIYLPLILQAVQSRELKDLPPPRGGAETILLAEDEYDVRAIILKILEGSGYRVIVAGDGEEAVNKFMENKDHIHLLVSDVIMPGKNGKEVYNEIRMARPDVKALFMSGYAEDVINNKIVFEGNLHFVSKPISPMELLRKVREILDDKSDFATLN